jgi:hypothetical protein
MDAKSLDQNNREKQDVKIVSRWIDDIEAEKQELVDKVQRRMDAVVDAAVDYIQDEPDYDWEKRWDALEATVNALLELRNVPERLKE